MLRGFPEVVDSGGLVGLPQAVCVVSGGRKGWLVGISGWKGGDVLSNGL